MSSQSLYVERLERDACGIGFIAQLKGKKSHQLIQDALYMLTRLEHRGARGADPDTGDGAGILFQIPDEFFRGVCTFQLPAPGSYGVGMLFLSQESQQAERALRILRAQARKLSLHILGFREVPTVPSSIGKTAASSLPAVMQIFIQPEEAVSGIDLERKLYLFRKSCEKAIRAESLGTAALSFASLSSQTLVYKGMLTTEQLGPFYPDLSDSRLLSAVALVHSRFSTNTFPRWELAQPFGFMAHNGEINTIQGNINNLKSKENQLASEIFSAEELEWLKPIGDPQGSDSANLNRILEFLYLSGRSLPHAMMMLIPEAWQGNQLMAEDKRAFYEYHSSLMEPWDGPASICFTDGQIVGATLDRNGLRPSRYFVTNDDRVIMSSEVDTLELSADTVVERGRLEPGRMFIVDMKQGRIISDEELKTEICQRQPYGDWLQQHKTHVDDLPIPTEEPNTLEEELIVHQQAFGYTREDLKLILAPMATSGKEPLGSMGADTPLAVLSFNSQHVSSYFKQFFAQVSNPPIDPLREKMVMALENLLGPCQNILAESPEHCKQICLPQPVLDTESFNKIRFLKDDFFKPAVISICYAEKSNLKDAIQRLVSKAEEMVLSGTNLLILSDRGLSAGQIPIPSLLATGAVQHHLLKCGRRSDTSIIVDGGDILETHHFACLLGYGAEAIYPRLAFQSIPDLISRQLVEHDSDIQKLGKTYIKAINYGLLKVFSKLGISTLQSYRSAQQFEILGLNDEVVDTCFLGTTSRIGGLGFEGLERELRARHQFAFGENAWTSDLPQGGFYQWKHKGEAHAFNPESIHALQYSARRNDYKLYKKYAANINDASKKAFTLRGLMKFKSERPSIPLAEVESKEKIFKRFATGAMSFGSISYEAHAALAVAMNRIGGKSNSGEGGEDEKRFEKFPNGDWERSAIKQVASGRFGVTSYYLSQAEELQIKMAQGAKPGEGGQLPGHKVDEWIGRVRHATPGVGLISPPPHHDIYSIEDLAQLIFDLKNANPDARVSVKLVAKAGVGTIAAGVAKAHADLILISGGAGGTGASPISSIRHAGLPWELGLAEAHQTLVKNKLRSRVRLQTDGQLRTGRDLAIAALLGAEEFGIATAALIVEGCILMRKCHLNTCPVGIATQDPDLRKRFTGKADHLVNFFTFLAEDLREIMAELGFRTVDEMIGQTQFLELNPEFSHWKIDQLNLDPILYKAPEAESDGLFKQIEQDHGLENVLDHQLIAAAQEVLENGKGKILKAFDICNTDRTTGAMLSYQVSKKFKQEGLPQGSLHYKFKGSAGQSFAAFGAPGIRFELEGEANDYVGKGLSGSEVIIYPSPSVGFVPHQHVILGNVAFYGATSGEAYLYGRAGERFCVRNSGMTAVVEGVGDHACEYMTGGRVLVLGPTGRNFAAGMSGGIAYVYDPEQKLSQKLNHEMVDLDPLSPSDLQTIKGLIQKHHQYTQSQTAVQLLTQWEEAQKAFVKVMPRDYKTALLKREERASERVRVRNSAK
jgi:glutamate synthase (NADPH/NADH) large chain